MAKINKEILGKVRGSLGDITFRQRNGKSYLSTRPASFVPGKDAASVARREKFGLNIKLSKTIYSIDELKSLWSIQTPSDKTTFNYICKVNYPLVGNGNLSGFIKLTPGLGFNIVNPVIAYNSSQISVNIDPLGTGTGIDAGVETSVKLLSVVYLNSPVDNSAEKYNFIKFSSAVQATVLDQPYEFIFPLSNIETQHFDSYQNKKGFFALVTLDPDGNILNYSNTFSG